MRTNDVLLALKSGTNFNLTRARELAEAQWLKGGWEGWLQVELAVALRAQVATREFDREVHYQHSNQRCDLFVQRASNASDHTFIEVKTIRFTSIANPIVNAWILLHDDVQKVETNAVVGIALLATFCSPVELAGAMNELLVGGRTAYVWDTRPTTTDTKGTVAQIATSLVLDVTATRRLMLIAVSPKQQT